MRLLSVLPRHRRLVVAVVAVAGIVLAGLLSDHSGAGSATSSALARIQQSWSSVPEYSSAPVLARGKVVSSAGVPVPGATVILFPVPLGPSPGRELTPLARATTDARGRFALHLPAASDGLLASARSGGALNLDIMAFYPGGIASWFTPVPAGMKPAVAPPATLVLHSEVASPSAGQ